MSAHRIRILLVEDDHAEVRNFRKALRASALPTRLDTAASIEEAVDAVARARIEKSPYDAIVLDPSLPDGDAVAAYQALARASSAPIIIMSEVAAPAAIVPTRRSAPSSTAFAEQITEALLKVQADPSTKRLTKREKAVRTVLAVILSAACTAAAHQCNGGSLW